MPCIFKTRYEIWDDKDGNTIEVTLDDGTKNIEIRCDGSGGYESLMFTQEQARMLAKALILVSPNHKSPFPVQD